MRCHGRLVAGRIVGGGRIMVDLFELANLTPRILDLLRITKLEKPAPSAAHETLNIHQSRAVEWRLE